MKLVFIIAQLLLLSVLVHAQITEGSIVYKQTTKFPLKYMQQIDSNSSIQHFTITGHSSYNQLLFNKNASLYRTLKSKNNLQEGMAPSMERYYYDLQTKYHVIAVEVSGKKFLLEHGTSPNWKLHKETKSILNYPCNKATTTSADGQMIEAWYTNSIPVAVGPCTFGATFDGLPGALLMVKMVKDDSEWSAVATKVQLKNIDRQLLQAPQQGKKIREKKFEDVLSVIQKELEKK